MDIEYHDMNLDVDSYTIDDIFKLVDTAQGDYTQLVENCDDIIHHFDNESNLIISNFFLRLKDRVLSHVADNGYNIATNFSDVHYESDDGDVDSIHDVDNTTIATLTDTDYRNTTNVSGSNIEQFTTQRQHFGDVSTDITSADVDVNSDNILSTDNMATAYTDDDWDNDVYMMGYKNGGVIYNSQKQSDASGNTATSAPSNNTVNKMHTTKYNRDLVIDSQFRPVGSHVSDFHMDLSEPLLNVISLELLYYQFVYSIYNIDSVKGTNVFYVTDDNSVTHEISVTSGLYKTIDALIVALNSAVVGYFSSGTGTFLDNYPDLAGKTNELIIFSYNELTGKIKLKLRNIFKYLKFFDLDSTSTQSKLNSNLGHFLGFRRYFKNTQLGIGYYTTEQPNEGPADSEVYPDPDNADMNVIDGEGIVDIQRPKYIILSIDDYNQNRLNQNVSIANEGTDNTIPIRITNKCNAEDINSLQIPTNPRTTSIKHIYAHNERVVETINELKKQPTRNIPAAIPDVFAMIPIEIDRTLGNLVSSRGINQSSNVRRYFGPVDIRKLRVRLFDEDGHILNLNNSDYCFTVGIEHMYDPNHKNATV